MSLITINSVNADATNFNNYFSKPMIIPPNSTISLQSAMFNFKGDIDITELNNVFFFVIGNSHWNCIYKITIPKGNYNYYELEETINILMNDACGGMSSFTSIPEYEDNTGWINVFNQDKSGHIVENFKFNNQQSKPPSASVGTFTMDLGNKIDITKDFVPSGQTDKWTKLSSNGAFDGDWDNVVVDNRGLWYGETEQENNQCFFVRVEEGTAGTGDWGTYIAGFGADTLLDDTEESKHKILNMRNHWYDVDEDENQRWYMNMFVDVDGTGETYRIGNWDNETEDMIWNSPAISLVGSTAYIFAFSFELDNTVKVWLSTDEQATWTHSGTHSDILHSGNAPFVPVVIIKEEMDWTSLC